MAGIVNLNERKERAMSEDIEIPTPHTERIRADQLVPWHGQRVLTKSRVRQFARNFDPELFDTLTVSRRGGLNYLVNGQHRWYAVMHILNRPDALLPCSVYEGLSDQQEAKLFHTQAPGVRVQVPAMHDARIMYEAGEAAMTTLVQAIESCGLHMVWSGDPQANGVMAIEAPRRILNAHGTARLVAVLTLVRDMLGPDPRALKAHHMLAAHQFLARYDALYDRQTLVAKIRPLGVDGLIREGLNQNAANGGDKPSGMGRAMLKVYNSGKRSQALPPWDSQSPYTSDLVISRKQKANTTRARDAEISREAAD